MEDATCGFLIISKERLVQSQYDQHKCQKRRFISVTYHSL
jgi:hypothetical protein